MMQKQEHQTCSNPSHSDPTKATNARMRLERKNKEGIKREGKFFKDNNGGERVEELMHPKVEEGLFIV